MTSSFIDQDPQNRLTSFEATAATASRSPGASTRSAARGPTVTSPGSPTTSNSSSSDVEAPNREESKEEETAEPSRPEIAGSGLNLAPSASRRHLGTSRPFVGPNPDSKNVDDTGKWGAITRKEKIIAASCGGLILVAIVVVVGVLVSGASAKGGQSSPSSVNTDTNATTNNNPPAAAPKAFETAEDKYAYLLSMLNGNSLTANATLQLPGFLRELDSINPASLTDPMVMATKWVMEVDAKNMVIDQLRDRFALASVYYGNNGENWLDNDRWLSSDHICDWGGDGSNNNDQVKCSTSAESGQEVVDELDLSSNNLTGTVLSSMALLTTLKGIWLRENHLSGNIPGEVFGSLPKLIILYLQDNNFEGEIPVSLLDSGSLGTLYVNGNNLTGNWPDAFCPSKENPDGPFTEFGLNCDQTPCAEDCCLPENNCFA